MSSNTRLLNFILPMLPILPSSKNQIFHPPLILPILPSSRKNMFFTLFHPPHILPILPKTALECSEISKFVFDPPHPPLIEQHDFQLSHILPFLPFPFSNMVINPITFIFVHPPHPPLIEETTCFPLSPHPPHPPGKACSSDFRSGQHSYFVAASSGLRLGGTGASFCWRTSRSRTDAGLYPIDLALPRNPLSGGQPRETLKDIGLRSHVQSSHAPIESAQMAKSLM